MIVRFLILHGWRGSGPQHWQTWLAGRLRRGGHEVRYPELPECDTPCPDRWGAALRREVALLRPGAGSVVICHSLACVLWLRHAATAVGERPVEKVLLVAPPCAEAAVPELDRFYPAPLDPAAIAAAAGHTRLVCSDDDPYCPSGAVRAYGEPLGLPVDVVPGAGHINPESGYGAWPEVEAWCMGRRSTLVPDAAAA